MFKVVPDQLRVAQGWVRCGQCSEVFEASLHLVPALEGAPDAVTVEHTVVPRPDQVEAVQASPTRDVLTISPHPHDASVDHFTESPDSKPLLTPESDALLDAESAPQDEARHDGDFQNAQTLEADEDPEVLSVSAFPDEEPVQRGIDAQYSRTSVVPDVGPSFQGELTRQEEVAADTVSAEVTVERAALQQYVGEIQPGAPFEALASSEAASHESERIEPIFSDDELALAPNAPPASGTAGVSVDATDDSAGAAEPEVASQLSFIRDAKRKAVWKTPMVRALLGSLLLVLLAALAGQWAVRQKDVLAAQEPRLAPLLHALCRPIGCEIRPLRRIESVLIESANFSKSGPNAYRLAFVLKNTGAAVVEIPALEVTLTDSRDQTLVRRVLLPAQFGATANTLQARSELAGAVTLKLADTGNPAGAAPSKAEAFPVAGYRMLAFYP